MRKFLSGGALSATVITANMGSVFANPTNIKIDNSVTVNSVAPKSTLVEIDGRTLTNAEAASIEGEFFFKPLAAAMVVNGIRQSATHFGDCRHGVRRDCSAGSIGRSFGSGLTFGIFR